MTITRSTARKDNSNTLADLAIAAETELVKAIADGETEQINELMERIALMKRASLLLKDTETSPTVAKPTTVSFEKLYPSLPVYTSDKNAVDFLDSFEWICCSQFNIERTLEALAQPFRGCFRGDAQLPMTRKIDQLLSEGKTWTDLREKFIARELSPQWHDNVDREIRSLRIGQGEKIANFTDRFELLASRVSSLNDSKYTSIFVEKLPLYIQQALQAARIHNANKYQTLSDVCEFANAMAMDSQTNSAPRSDQHLTQPAPAPAAATQVPQTQLAPIAQTDGNDRRRRKERPLIGTCRLHPFEKHTNDECRGQKQREQGKETA